MLEFLNNKKVACIILLVLIVLITGLVFFKREGYDVTPEDEFKLNALLMKGGMVSEKDQAYVLSALKKLRDDDN
jgi:hypothetical protein